MKYNVSIGIVMVVMMMLLTGAVYKVEMGPPTFHEKIVMSESYAEVKCDPCDYNLDYGDTYNPDKAGIDEGIVKLECDPCDYNIDYGETDHPLEK